MKKIITLLLTLCLILSCTAVLAACKEEHVHEFKNEWSGDASHHWHTCSGENCLEVSEKAAHEWRELGGIVSCSVCGASADVATPDEKTWN